MGVEFVIRDAFTRAKAYQKSWQEYDKKKGPGLEPRSAAPRSSARAARRDSRGQAPGARALLSRGRDPDADPAGRGDGLQDRDVPARARRYKVAKEIAAHGAGASTFSDWWAYKVEAIDAIPENAAIMTRKGVLVSVNSDSAEHARRLNTEAAKSIKWGGLSEDEAFRMVTINPAKQLRIDNRVGSLEVGKDADVVVWNHHPLSSYAIVERAYIDGTVYYDRRGEERRLTELQKEKSSLASAEQGTTRPASANPQEPKATSQERMSGPQAESEPQQTSGTSGRAPAQATAAQPAQQAGPQTVTAITNARIHPIAQPDIERGTIVIRGKKIEAIGANVPVPAGREGRRRRGRRRLSGVHQRADADGAQRTGPARVRRRERDAGRQSAAPHPGGVPRGERRDSRLRAPTGSRPSPSCRAAALSAARSR